MSRKLDTPYISRTCVASSSPLSETMDENASTAETTNVVQPHRVVIVGGGFGGLNAARSLKRAPVEVTLIDRRNFHLFQPLLYQVATGGLSPANIAAPLRSIVERQKNCRDHAMGDVGGTSGHVARPP